MATVLFSLGSQRTTLNTCSLRQMANCFSVLLFAQSARQFELFSPNFKFYNALFGNFFIILQLQFCLYLNCVTTMHLKLLTLRIGSVLVVKSVCVGSAAGTFYQFGILFSSRLRNTGRQFLGGPRSVGLAVPFGFSNQLVPFATMVRDLPAERVALAGVPSVGRIRWLTTGTGFTGNIRPVPAGLPIHGQTLGPGEPSGSISGVTVVLNGRIQIERGLLGKCRVTGMLDYRRLKTVNVLFADRLASGPGSVRLAQATLQSDHVVPVGARVHGA